jgi:hypothetical protein
MSFYLLLFVFENSLWTPVNKLLRLSLLFCFYVQQMNMQLLQKSFCKSN